MSVCILKIMGDDELRLMAHSAEGLHSRPSFGLRHTFPRTAPNSWSCSAIRTVSME